MTFDSPVLKMLHKYVTLFVKASWEGPAGSGALQGWGICPAFLLEPSCAHPACTPVPTSGSDFEEKLNRQTCILWPLAHKCALWALQLLMQHCKLGDPWSLLLLLTPWSLLYSDHPAAWCLRYSVPMACGPYSSLRHVDPHVLQPLALQKCGFNDPWFCASCWRLLLLALVSNSDMQAYPQLQWELAAPTSGTGSGVAQKDRRGFNNTE